MATVNKDFKIKSGLIVEGTTATVNGYDVLTKKAADEAYIIGLIGGSATSEATPDTVVLRDENADFAAGTITADIVGNVTGTVSDISNHDTDDLSEGTNNLYFSEFRAQTAVSNALGTGLSYGSQGAGNVFLVDENHISTKAYAESVAQTAQDNAEDYAELKASDAQAAAIETASQDATTKANNAQSAAEDYADGLAVNYDAAGSATTAYNNAVTYADGLASNYDPAGSASTAQTNAQNYADTAIANLVDSAPATLDTLNELAAALQDNPDIIGDLQDIAAGKQDTLTAGNGIVIDEDAIIYIPTSLGSGISVTPEEVSLDRTTVDTWYDANGAADDAETAANSYTDGQITTALSTAQGYANTAEQNAKDYADDLDTDDVAEGTANLYFTNQRAIDAVGGTIGDAIDELTTDDIEEGETNLYFEDGRAKSSAADLLTGATLNNITITGSGAGLTITAENGVADSDTDDLAEGSTNLYFTDERAVSAISGSDISPDAIDITWVRREEATWTDVNTASKATCHSTGTENGSMKYLVRVVALVGGTRHSHVTEVLATVDNSNGVAVVEYGTIYTSPEPLAAVTVEWNAGTSKYDLNVTTANNNSEVMVAATLIATID